MRSREVQQLLVNLTDRLTGDVDTRTRWLRKIEDGISSGPRGSSAPHMNSVEWAMHLGALVAPRVPDVGQVIDNLNRCIHRPTAQTAPLFDRGITDIRILVVIAYAIEHGLNFIGNVEIDEQGRHAWVNLLPSVGGGRMFFSTDPEADGEFVDATTIGNRFVIGAVALRSLHKAFTDDASARATVATEVA